MKSIKLSLVLFAIIATIFVGCSKEEEEKLLNPTISFASDGTGFYVADAEVDSNAQVKVKIIAQKGKDGANLKQFKATKTVTGATETLLDSTLTSASNETFNYTYTGNIVTSPTTLTFTITDKDGKTATKSIKFTIKAGATITKPKYESMRTFNHMASFDLEGKTSQSGSTAPSNPNDYDLYYFYSNNTSGNLVAAGYQRDDSLYGYKATWSGSNNINIRENASLNETLFDSLKDQDQSAIMNLYNNGTDVPQIPGFSTTSGIRVKDLSSSSFYVIRTSSNKYAVIKINSTSQASISIDYLIQN